MLLKKQICITTVLLVFGLFRSCQAQDGQVQAQPVQPRHVATLNYGKVLFHCTGIAAYTQAENGTMVPSPELTEAQVKELNTAIENIDRVLEEMMEEHRIALVVRENSRPFDMSPKELVEFNFGLVAIAEDEQTERQRLRGSLTKRVRGYQIDLTRLVIEAIEKEKPKVEPRIGREDVPEIEAEGESSDEQLEPTVPGLGEITLPEGEWSLEESHTPEVGAWAYVFRKKSEAVERITIVRFEKGDRKGGLTLAQSYGFCDMIHDSIYEGLPSLWGKVRKRKGDEGEDLGAGHFLRLPDKNNKEPLLVTNVYPDHNGDNWMNHGVIASNDEFIFTFVHSSTKVLTPDTIEEVYFSSDLKSWPDPPVDSK